ncbi:MAG: hypothetical protein F6K42_22805 [Leptolyngbya sp. SIO1D8]|nr:hypothetical protein [Leptolyngbya sp. SIO1D8]
MTTNDWYRDPIWIVKGFSIFARTPSVIQMLGTQLIPILRGVVTDVEAESIVMSTFFNPKSKIQNRELV